MMSGRLLTGLAAALALTVPAWLLYRVQPSLPSLPAPGETVLPVTAPDAEPERRLFLDPLSPALAVQAEDAPQLVGVVGRLPDNAIAMVRSRDGKTATLAPGQSHEGWTLVTLSPDAALFAKGERRVRSFLAAGDPEPEVDEGEPLAY
jgi:hypothetical protein